MAIRSARSAISYSFQIPLTNCSPSLPALTDFGYTPQLWLTK
jgi:hypothetical protein